MMKMTQRYEVWDRRTRWKTGYNKTPNTQEYFHQLETLKASSPSVPCLEITGVKSSWGATNNHKDLTSKPRKVLMQITKGNSGRSLAKSNLLPPIYSSRISTSTTCAKICVPSLGVGCQETKLEKGANIARTDKALFSRQKQECHLTSTSQLIFSGLTVFNEKEPEPAQKEKNLRNPLVTEEPQDGPLAVEPSNLSSNDRERTEDPSGVSKDRCVLPLSDSAIEMDSESSRKKENEEERNRTIDSQEEEYYTDQMITAWIVKVNESLFSSSKEEITDQTLEEQDVDTIKIIYGQD